MRKFGAIWQRELMAHFLSPTAYVAAVIFLATAGWTFLWVADKAAGSGDPLTVVLIASVIVWLPILATVVTMGAFAEEKRSGTIEALMTAPVTEPQVVFGKYMGALTFYAIVVAPTAAYPDVLAAFLPDALVVDRASLASGYAILFLVAAYCISVGLFISLLTRHQVVSAIGCFCAITLPFLFRMFSRALPLNLRGMLDYAAVEDHVMLFARGVVDTRPVILYLTGAALFLFLSVRALESRRWL